MEPLIVSAGIIHRDDRILIAQRKSDSSVARDLWEFPGGKLDPGETIEDCLKREIEEELGLTIDVIGFYASNRHVYAGKPFPIDLRAYRARWVRGEIELRDCQDARWVLPRELAGYDFAPADIPIVRKFYAEFA